jgi:hypothetical protein
VFPVLPIAEPPTIHSEQIGKSYALRRDHPADILGLTTSRAYASVLAVASWIASEKGFG